MNLRLVAMALSIIAASASASAETGEFAAIARASGTPEIPGLKMVWLAPWGDVAKAHPWRNIIVHQTGTGRVGAPRCAGAVQNSDPARRHGLGGNGRHGVLGGRG